MTFFGCKDAAIAAIIAPGEIVSNGVEMTPYSIGQGADPVKKISHLIT